MFPTRIKIKMGRVIPFLLFALVIFILASGYFNDNSAKSADEPGPNEVFMIDEEFVPETKTVTTGTTIKWINKEDDKHDVVSGTPDSQTDLFDSGKMKENDEFSYKFTEAGKYPYFCSYHPDMTGTIIVE